MHLLAIYKVETEGKQAIDIEESVATDLYSLYVRSMSIEAKEMINEYKSVASIDIDLYSFYVHRSYGFIFVDHLFKRVFLPFFVKIRIRWLQREGTSLEGYQKGLDF
jgi:hypothetical protein